MTDKNKPHPTVVNPSVVVAPTPVTAPTVPGSGTVVSPAAPAEAPVQDRPTSPAPVTNPDKR